MSVVVKVSCQGEIRRTRIETEHVSYDNVVKAMSDMFPGLKDYTAKYLDEEGDACTLCEAAFDDFLTVSTAASKLTVVLKLDLFAAPKPAPPAPANEPKNFEQHITKNLENVLRGLCGNEDGFQKIDFDMMRQFSHCPMGPMMCAVDPMLGVMGSMTARCEGAGPTSNTTFLTPRIMASFAVGMLPRILPHLIEAGANPSIGFGAKLAMDHVPQLREILQALKLLLEKTKGLEHCAEPLDIFLAGNVEVVQHFLLSLTTSLDVLPFDEQIDFFETAFSDHWVKIQHFLSMPFISEHIGQWQHRFVGCDGCNASPIKGPRFKCKSIDNFDLCGECFAKKNTINDGRCADHEFECIPVDFMGMGGCPGMCPGMLGRRMCGKGKGKGDHKGCRTSQAEQQPQEVPKRDTDQSNSNENTGEMKRISEEQHNPGGKEDAEIAKELPTVQRFAMPVMLDDGRQILLEWEAGADLHQVATAWVLQNGIPEEFVPQLVDVAQQLIK